MKRLLAALVVLLALAITPARAQSDEAAIRSIVRNLYSDYQTKAASPSIRDPRATARFAAVEKQCAETARLLDKKEPDSSYGYCANDYGVWCQCQDFEGIDFAHMKVEVKIAGADGAATLWFTGGEGPDLRLAFRRAGKGWALDDIWEYPVPEGDEPAPEATSYRTRLVSDINEMRATLKLPPWTEPKI
ncbi:hypothetical protein [Sphingomonas soli]|uniref:hypothetical protein n=1 Tax=Sphingomonas soli TaxID=266127 RepID=UPI000831E208|nr:hypothetical protein [Sphingomonas soli]